MKRTLFVPLILCFLTSSPAAALAEKPAEKKPATVATSTAVSVASAPAAPAAFDPSKKLGSREDAKRLFDETMNFFVTDRIAEAFQRMKPNFPLPPAELDTIQKDIVQKRVFMKERFGPSIGFVYLGQDALSEVFARYIYVEKFERHAIRWLFVVYKPRDVWIVNAVSFDDKLDEHYKPVS